MTADHAFRVGAKRRPTREQLAALFGACEGAQELCVLRALGRFVDDFSAVPVRIALARAMD